MTRLTPLFTLLLPLLVACGSSSSSSSTAAGSTAANGSGVAASPAPTSSFSVSTTEGPANLSLTFHDESLGNPDQWDWSFGDGNSSSQQHPSHTYTQPGVYTVSLTVTNAYGDDTIQLRDLITVLPGTQTGPNLGGSTGVQVGIRFWFENDTFGNPFKTHSPSEQSLASDVLALVNQVRQANGLQPLTYDPQAEVAAKAHAEDMHARNYFSHVSPEGWDPNFRLALIGIPATVSAENIAQGQQTPTDVMTAWLNSPGHRANILDPNVTHLGVGVVEASRTWVQVFRRP